MNRFRISLGFKLVISFMIVVFFATSIPIVYELSFLFNHIYKEATMKMDSDIEIASLVFNKHEQMLLRIARSMSRDMWIGKIVAYPTAPQTKVTMIRERARGFLSGFEEADISFMLITDSTGKILYRSEQESESTLYADIENSIVNEALKGREAYGYRIASADELWSLGLTDARPGPASQNSGLVLEAAVPIISADEPHPSMEGSEAGPGVVGIIIAGYWLNMDRNVLSEIKRRTRCAASIYIPDGLVNSTDHHWMSGVPEDFLKSTKNYKRKVVPYPARRELSGYLPLYGLPKKPAALLELRSSTESINSVWKSSLKNSAVFMAFGIMLSMVLGLIITRRITMPVNALKSGTEEIGRGNLSHRINVRGGDELSQLADGFNVMAIRLARTMEEMRFSKQQVEEYSNRLKTVHASLEMYSMELEKVNQQLLDSNIKLQKANEIKDTFLSTVSHELKTPLTTVIGYVSMLLEGSLGLLSDEQRQALEVVQRRGNNLKDLINDLLDLSRIDSGKIELRRRYLDIAHELRNVEEVFQERLIANGQQMMISVGENVPRINADGERLAQVFFNLVGNAIKFTPPEGTITVRVTYLQDSNHVSVSVSDTGIGIPQSELTHIFDRFYQVDRRDGREYPGTGLGLSIAKELVELHGGRIWAESREGIGSTIHFTLPL